MSEDKATQRCDPSAGMGVSGGSDATCVTLFTVARGNRITLLRKPQSDKPRGFGGWPPNIQNKAMFAIQQYLKA